MTSGRKPESAESRAPAVAPIRASEPRFATRCLRCPRLAAALRRCAARCARRVPAGRVPRMRRSSRCSAAFPRIASSPARKAGGRRSWVPGSASTRAIPRARHGLSRRPGRQLHAASPAEDSRRLSSYDQARGPARHRAASRMKSLHAIVGASYGGMVALCFAEALCGARGAHRGAERGRQVPGAVDGVAQRAAADRARGHRARRRPVGTEARARARHGHLSQRRRVRAALRRRAGARSGSISDFRSRIICSRAATTMCRSTAPSPFWP